MITASGPWAARRRRTRPRRLPSSCRLLPSVLARPDARADERCSWLQTLEPSSIGCRAPRPAPAEEGGSVASGSCWATASRTTWSRSFSGCRRASTGRGCNGGKLYYDRECSGCRRVEENMVLTLAWLLSVEDNMEPKLDWTRSAVEEAVMLVMTLPALLGLRSRTTWTKASTGCRRASSWTMRS